MMNVQEQLFDAHFRNCLSVRVKKDKKARSQKLPDVKKKDCGCNKKKQQKS